MGGVAKKNWSLARELSTNVGGCLSTRHQRAKLIDSIGCDLVRSWNVALCSDTRADWVSITVLHKETTCYDTSAFEYAFAEGAKVPMVECKIQESPMRLFVSSVVSLSTSDVQQVASLPLCQLLAVYQSLWQFSLSSPLAQEPYRPPKHRQQQLSLLQQCLRPPELYLR